MIHLKLNKEQLDELHKQAAENPCVRARRKCWVVYLKGNGYAHQEIVKVVRVDEDSITAYLKKYRDGGLPGFWPRTTARERDNWMRMHRS